MRPLHRALLAAALFLSTTTSAAGQCRVSAATAYLGRGAIDRGRAIVAENDLNEAGLAVRFYEKSLRGWTPQESFEVGDVQVFFPNPVAIDGDRAIAGCPEATGLEHDFDFLTGRASVFDRIGGNWVRTELVSATNGVMDCFGSSVDISGDVAVVGASHSAPDGFGDHLGRVHVFEFDGTSWTEVAQLMTYGAALAVERDTIVVGDDRTFPGRVHVFRKEAGLWTWTNTITLSIPPPVDGPFLGSAVALQGDTLVVGAALPWIHAGYVEVFRRETSGYWQPVQHVVPGDGAPYDQFGRSLSFSGTTLLVGAPGAGPTHEGLVYRFERSGGSFVHVDRIEPDPRLGGGFGDDVALERQDAILSTYTTASFFRLGFESLSPFCPTTPNSTGSPGNLSAAGCDSLRGESLTLIARGLPAGVLGVCFFGGTATQVPFGDGYRCAGSPIHRFPGGTTNATGGLVQDVDFSSGAGANLAAGRTWHFQVVHRDPGSSGAGFNLTNALSIFITP